MTLRFDLTSKVFSIRSGGQTGVDRAALDVAIFKKIPYSGWCPKGGWAEDFPGAPGLLGRYPQLIETPSAAPEQRTAWNVRDSHATLLLSIAGNAGSEGTLFTKMCAELIFLRPHFEADPSVAGALDEVRHWLAATIEDVAGSRFDLNIAGPRESKRPGLYDAAYDFLSALF